MFNYILIKSVERVETGLTVFFSSFLSYRRLHETRTLRWREEKDEHSLRVAHQSFAYVARRKFLRVTNNI